MKSGSFILLRQNLIFYSEGLLHVHVHAAAWCTHNLNGFQWKQLFPPKKVKKCFELSLPWLMFQLFLFWQLQLLTAHTRVFL